MPQCDGNAKKIDGNAKKIIVTINRNYYLTV
jgi:hypothetical protein